MKIFQYEIDNLNFILARVSQEEVSLALEYLEDLEYRLLAGATQQVHPNDMINMFSMLAQFRNRNKDSNYNGPHFIKLEYGHDAMRFIMKQCWAVECKWNTEMVYTDGNHLIIWMEDPEELLKIRLGI